MSRYIDPRNKILRHPELLVKIRNAEPVWPLNVEMDISNACNLKCKHCDFEYTHDGVMMAPELAERIFQELAEGGTRAITLTGGGEPTTNSHFAEIVEAAHSAGLQIGLYTNGVNVDGLLQVLDKLLWVYVSLDAANANAYKESKWLDGFEQVTENIRRLVAMKTYTTIGIGFLLTDVNWVNIPSMVAVYDELGPHYCQFRPVVGLDDYDWIGHALRWLEQEYADRSDVQVHQERFQDMQSFSRGYKVCRASALTPCIGTDGTVWVCPNTRGLRPLGNLKEESFVRIWQRRQEQIVGEDCREACRNHYLNESLEYICCGGPHDSFA